MLHTLTYSVSLHADARQSALLSATCDTYLSCCNRVSETAHENRTLSQKKLNKLVYHELRERYGVGAQMAQSAIIRVIGNYRTIKELQGNPWKAQPNYTTPGYDLVWNRDYSILKDGRLSINTIQGRVKIDVDWTHMPDEYRHGRFGTARILKRRGKWMLLIPSTVTIPDPPRPQQVIGVDIGIRFLATVYDADGDTTFYSGKEVTRKRAHYKQLRTDLQKRGTRSARRRLKSIGDRENRWMRDVNHQVSKALVNQYGKDTLFTLEDLEGVRNATERVKVRQRYVQVSWAFSQLRSFIEYKAARNGQATVAVDPAYTSQTCPRCGHVSARNRDKRNHIFICRNCGYRSNDDRVGAMNLRHKGYDLTVMQYDANMIDVAGVQPTIP